MIYILILYVIAQGIFDTYAVLGTTAADITYNAMTYSFVAAICAYLTVRDGKFKMFYILIGLLYLKYMAAHLVCWGMDYEKYRQEIEREGNTPVYSLALIVVFIVFYIIKFKPWRERLSFFSRTS